MKHLKALDGYIRVNVPVRLIVTEDELKNMTVEIKKHKTLYIVWLHNRW